MPEQTFKIPGPSIGWTDLLDDVIREKIKGEDEAKKKGEKKSNPLRPSSAGFCGRHLAYAVAEYRGKASYPRPPIEPTLHRIFSVGHALEKDTLQQFRMMKFVELRYSQQVLTFFKLQRGIESKEEFIEGSTDGVLYSEKFKAVFDIKTKKDSFSKAYKSSWDESLSDFDEAQSLIKISNTAYYADDLMAFIEELGDDFLTDNLLQLNLYANSSFLKERGVDHAFIWRINKNDSRHVEIRFRPSKEAFEKVREKFNRVSVAVDHDKTDEVDRDYILGSIRCSFCPYSKQCWGDGKDALKEWFRTLPQKNFPKLIDPDHPLDGIFKNYESLLEVVERFNRMSIEIQKILVKMGISHLRLQNGHVYQLKNLVSPRPHFEIRRSK